MALDGIWGGGVGEGESSRLSPNNDQLYLQNQVRVFQTSYLQEILEMFFDD